MYLEIHVGFLLVKSYSIFSPRRGPLQWACEPASSNQPQDSPKARRPGQRFGAGDQRFTVRSRCRAVAARLSTCYAVHFPAAPNPAPLRCDSAMGQRIAPPPGVRPPRVSQSCPAVALQRHQSMPTMSCVRRRNSPRARLWGSSRTSARKASLRVSDESKLRRLRLRCRVDPVFASAQKPTRRPARDSADASLTYGPLSGQVEPRAERKPHVHVAWFHNGVYVVAWFHNKIVSMAVARMTPGYVTVYRVYYTQTESDTSQSVPSGSARAERGLNC